jgi:hypothetical protein
MYTPEELLKFTPKPMYIQYQYLVQHTHYEKYILVALYWAFFLGCNSKPKKRKQKCRP